MRHCVPVKINASGLHRTKNEINVALSTQKDYLLHIIEEKNF